MGVLGLGLLLHHMKSSISLEDAALAIFLRSVTLTLVSDSPVITVVCIAHGSDMLKLSASASPSAYLMAELLMGLHEIVN